MPPFDRRRCVLYVLFPAAAVGGCIALYFSGVPRLQTLVAPAGQREFGLVENFQNAILVGLVILCWRSARYEFAPLARQAWRLLGLAVVLLLLEELDYGDHLHRWITDRPPRETPLSLHNRGNRIDLLKNGADVGMVLLFVVLPLLRDRLAAHWRPWIATRWSVATLLLGHGLSSLAHALEDGGALQNGSLRGNISEFREVVTYWVFALYVREVARRRRRGGDDRLASSDDDAGPALNA